ncbi:MAG: metallophosphoesterase [Clostridia bacterium]|nr:metallophosphoesterase [Clostridia bacterium]
MQDKKSAREWFYSQGKAEVVGAQKCAAMDFYRLEYTGQYICEVNIDSGLEGDAVEIDQITDVHFNFVSIADEGDREIQGTKLCRRWNAEGASVKSAIKAMDAAQFADQTVITGDVLDFLSRGAMMLTKKHIIDRDPEVLMTLGAHDYTKQMQTRLPNELPKEERLAQLAEIWPHDMFYHSKAVGKVLAVCLDNSDGGFPEVAVSRLASDIEAARREGKIILAFMHEPIAPKSGVGEVWTVWPSDGNPESYDFDTVGVGADPNADEATRAVYALLTENADVIRGIFCGHMHSVFYTEVRASYTDKCVRHEALIPQFCSHGNSYHHHAGIVTRIIVK